MAGWNHDNANWRLKKCAVCEKEFKPSSGVHKFCSAKCKGRWKYISGIFTTESQYKNISNNWDRYISRLLAKNPRKTLTRQDVLDVLDKQQYKCALSGEELTCVLVKGKRIVTNASIDRIAAGGPYTKENIQIVCTVLNGFRTNTAVNEFIEWCTKVADYNRR